MEAVTRTLEPTLPKEFYFSPEIYAREQERIFWRQWVCAGREEQLPRTGDVLVRELAGESVFIVRGKDGVLRAFYNVCRHRGSQLFAPAEVSGVAEPDQPANCGSTIRCPYHSWTYELDGSLRTAPFLEEGADFQKHDFPLHAIALETWGGFIFLYLTPGELETGMQLRDHLNGVPHRLERYQLDDLRVARRLVYDVAANWKVLVENYNECYHCGGVHPELCNIVPQFKKAGGGELDWDRGIPQKAGTFTFTFSGKTDRRPFPGLSADEAVRHKGELVYPNFMLSLSADHVTAFTLWPQGPGRTIVLCDFLFHPHEMARPSFDPSDAVEFWDLINQQDWSICERVQRGMNSRVFATGYYAPMESWSLDIRRYIGERLELPVQR